MIAVDEEGKPTQVPKLKIENEIQQRRWDAAIKRRELRLEASKKEAKE